MSFLIKYSLLICLICCLKLKLRQVDPLLVQGENDDMLSALQETKTKVDKLYDDKLTNFFSENYYDHVNKAEITQNAGNLMENNEKSWKSFRKLNNIMNKVWEGDKAVKSDGQVKRTLNTILKDQSLKTKTRVEAAKLGARMTDLPVTIQITEPDINRSGKDFTSHVIVPRIHRIYRPDYYVENYKAGNWGLDAIY
jgi:hypothetical protein